jgi:hypothetical protein
MSRNSVVYKAKTATSARALRAIFICRGFPMKFRNHAFVCALAFLCTLLSAAPTSARAEEDDGLLITPTTAADVAEAKQDAGSTAVTVPFIDSAIVPAEYNGDVRDLPPEYARSFFHMMNEFEPPQVHKPVVPQVESINPIPPVASAAMPAPTQNFAGLSFSQTLSGSQVGAGWPPDTNGDVGPVYYIQAVNDAWGIFNKSTGALVAGFTENQLWSGAGTGTPCDANNFGDPVAIHDGLADRWILTDFAFTLSGGNPVGPFYQCFAVSKTNDPVAGGYFLYAVRMDSGASGGPPTGTFVDYPKFGLWTDCLYMGANGFNNASGAYAGPVFAAFDRTALFAGSALTATNSSLGFISATTTFGLFPANLLGTSAASLPPAGTAEYFVDESGTAFAFDVRKFTAGATSCGSGATLGAATVVTQASYGYPANVAGSTTNVVGQPSTTNKLDSLGDELMQRVNYRKIGSAESLWVIHTTCGTAQSANGTCSSNTTSRTQPQWAQINVTGGTIATTPVQQQIYAPDATLNRWMGSIAVDGQGNMAIGYSTSNPTSPNFPSLAYSGRLAGDTANQLPQTETQLAGGLGSQNLCGTTACQRWGDYSSMTIDPSDDCTFWYTSEYYAAAANATNGHWDTRIGSFKFPTCTTTAAAATKLVFTQQPNASYASNAAITVKVTVEDAGGNVVTTDTSSVTVALTTAAGATLGGTQTVAAVNGVATFNNLTVDKVGTYTLTATDGTLTSAVSSAFNITAGAAAKLAFAQQPTNTAAGASITPALTVQIQDASGNLTSSTASVTIAIGTNPSAGTLGGTATVSAVAGVATFSNLSIDKVGTGYTLGATSAGLTSATSTAFNITAGGATKLVFAQQPTNTTAAASITPAVTVQVQDASGNVVTSSTASVTIAIGTNPSAGTLSGTVTVNAVAGVATFSNLSIDKVGTGYTLSVTSAGLTSATSSTFNITAGVASKLVFTQQPTNTASASSITPAVMVQVQDASGNLTSSTAAVTMAIGTNPSAGTLSGTLTVNAVAGVATFSNLSIDKVGTGYTLGATSAGLTSATSSAFNITAGAAAKLVFAQQPTTTTAGSTITPAVTVQVQDASGNLVATSTASVTLAIAPGTGTIGAVLLGTTTVAATGGVATFNNLSIGLAGTGYKLNSTSTGLTTAQSAAFDITAASGNKLVFSQQPTNAVSGASIAPAITVQVQDLLGNVVTSSTAAVTIAIGTNPSAGTLSGTATVNAVSGVATFSNLSINKAGTGYTLNATSTGLTTAQSSAFNISAGAAAKLAFAQQPSNAAAGASITPALTVQIQDASGNLTSSTAAVTLAIGTNPSAGTLSGTATVNAVAGVATFSTLSINNPGTGYTLGATSAGLTGVTSSAFNITAGAAAKLVFAQQPSNAAAGASITPAVTVQIQDAGGNLTNSTAAVTLAIATNPSSATLGGTVSVNAVAGVATFGNLSIDKTGTGYTLGAASTGLTGATSSAFTISAGAAAKLVFAQQPSNAVAGASIAPPVTVQVQDANGNMTSSSVVVTLAIGTNPGAGTLSGTATASAVAGVATFSNLSINKAGTGYTLAASSAGLTGATSSAFNIAAGAAASISFSTQPVTSAAGATIPVVAHVQDANGNPIAADNVTLTIANNVASSTLAVTANPVSTNAAGNATFAGVSLNKAGTGYTLKITDANTLTTNSAAFNITAGAATQLVFTTQPADVLRGAELGTIAVTEKDADGNVVPDNAAVDFTVVACGGPVDLGSVAMTNGVATLSSVQRFYTIASGKSVSATQAALNATSATFNVVATADYVFADGYEACRP